MRPSSGIEPARCAPGLKAVSQRDRRFTARLSRLSLDPSQLESLRQTVADSRVDWAGIVSAAHALRAAPLVDFALARLGDPPGVPAEAKKRLWMESESWRRWNLRLVAEGEEILAAMRSEGFRVLPIKGFDLARRLYPEVRLRPMVDVDLLLPDDDMAPACEFLKRDLGFVEEGGDRPVRHARYYRKRILARVREKDTFCLDLHSVFYHPHLYPIDYGAVWSRAGSEDPLLAVEDCLLHSCLILAKDRYQTDLRDLIDIHEMLVRWNPDWSAVDQRSRAWGCSVALFFSLCAAKSVLESPVPDRILKNARPGFVRRKWLEVFLSVDRIPAYRYVHGNLLPKIFLRLPLADSPLGWARFLKERAAVGMGAR